MIESRCGILCSNCKLKQEVGCQGCIEIKKPFWGEQCPIKSCCEQKKTAHCGECADFPCSDLNQFAYDKEQGDDGLRIRQCQQWRTQ